MLKAPTAFIDPNRVKAVIFDAFGTLFQIVSPRRPYRQLLDAAARTGRLPRPDDAAQVMSKNCDLAGIASWLDVGLSPATLAEIERDMREELSTVQLYPEALSTIQRLKEAGFKIGVCSNLAAPYTAPILKALPDALDIFIWSFEVGAVKPDPAIYAAICTAGNFSPDEVLFVGDTITADVIGPRSFGMQAIHLARDEESPEPMFLSELGELLPMLLTNPRSLAPVK